MNDTSTARDAVNGGSTSSALDAVDGGAAPRVDEHDSAAFSHLHVIAGHDAIAGPQGISHTSSHRHNATASSHEENQKKYAENDTRFQSSPLLKKLLKQSKLIKEKNRKEIENKYFILGAEWGVGDCSAEGMLPEEREKFIAMLKQKAEEKYSSSFIKGKKLAS